MMWGSHASALTTTRTRAMSGLAAFLAERLSLSEPAFSYEAPPPQITPAEV
jgi:hypothetical protein